MTLNVDQLLDTDGMTVIVGRPGQWLLQSINPEVAYSHEFTELLVKVGNRLDPHGQHMPHLVEHLASRHCTLCGIDRPGDYMCRQCVQLHTEPAGSSESSARTQLAAVRKWMAEHCREPAHRETLHQLSDVMLHAFTEEEPNGQ